MANLDFSLHASNGSDQVPSPRLDLEFDSACELGNSGTGGSFGSIGLSMPSDVFAVANSPLTSSGTFGVTFNTQLAHTIFAGPTSGGAATPAFRLLVASDIPDLSSTYVTGANNGLSKSTSLVQLGQDIGAIGDPATLLSNREIPTNGKTFKFKDGGNEILFLVDQTIATGVAALDITGSYGGLIHIKATNTVDRIFPGIEWYYNGNFKATIGLDKSGSSGGVTNHLFFDTPLSANGVLSYNFEFGGNGSVVFYATGSSFLGLFGNKNVKIGDGVSPTATLHLAAGAATAGKAAFKFTTGVNLTTPEAGAMEWDGDRLFITQVTGPTRKTIAYTSDLASTIALSSITAAIASNSIDNLNFLQTWNWNTLASGIGLQLFSNSVLATSSSQELVRVELSGANTNAGQTTTSLRIRNQHSGSTSSNIGLQVDSITATNNYAIIVPASGGNVGIGTSTPTSIIKLHVVADAGTFGIAGISGSGGVGVYGETSNASGIQGIHTTTGGVGVLGSATAAVNTNTASTFIAQNGMNNYAIIVPVNSGTVGIGTSSPIELLSLGTAGTQAGVISFAGSTSGKIIIQPAAIAGTYTLTLPTTDGNTNEFLQTNGSGVLTWAASGAGITIGSTTITSGTAGRVLYDNSGVVGEYITVPVANGGTNIASYSIGDMIYASGATTLVTLADVAVGSYLRSGGITTAPLWSTLILPNAATTNRIVYATSTNTWGESANFTFTGSIFTQTSAVTTGGTTSSAQVLSVNSLTSGTGYYVASSSLTSGNLIQLVSSSTTLASGNQILDIASSGANGTNAITATGVRISVTNTNATSGTNTGLSVTASGATTKNLAISATGDILVALANVSGTTGTAGFSMNANSMTTGTAMYITSTSISSGTLLQLRNTSTAISGANEALDVVVIATNAATGVTATGIRVTVNNTNATSGTNIGMDITARDATTDNIAIDVDQYIRIFPKTSGTARLRLASSGGVGFYGDWSIDNGANLIFDATVDPIFRRSGSNIWTYSASLFRINGSAGNYSFQVSGQTTAALFYVKGTSGSEGVGIGTSTPGAWLDIALAGTTSKPSIKLLTGTLVSTIAIGNLEYNNAFYVTSNALNRVGIGGSIADFTTDAANSGTGETDLATYTTKVSTLALTGERLVMDYTIALTDATADKVIRVLFGGTEIYTSGTLTSGVGTIRFNVLIIRTGSTTARAVVTGVSPLLTAQIIETDLTGLTFTNTNILKFTGQASGATGGSGDITGKLGHIFWFPAASN